MYNVFGKRTVENTEIKNSILKRIDETEDLLENMTDYTFEYFFNTVRATFAEIFDIDFQFTFEELIYKLNNIDKSLHEINKRIDEIKKKIKEANHKKPKRSSKKTEETIKKLDIMLNQEMDREKKYIHLNSVLLDSNFKTTVFLFSQRFSNMRYSNTPASKEELSALIGAFKQIVYYVIVPGAEEIKKNTFFMRSIFGKLSVFFKRDKVSKILKLLERGKKQIDKNNINAAKNCYLKIINIYHDMSLEEVEQVYPEIAGFFNLIKQRQIS